MMCWWCWSTAGCCPAGRSGRLCKQPCMPAVLLLDVTPWPAWGCVCVTGLGSEQLCCCQKHCLAWPLPCFKPAAAAQHWLLRRSTAYVCLFCCAVATCTIVFYDAHPAYMRSSPAFTTCIFHTPPGFVTHKLTSGSCALDSPSPQLSTTKHTAY
jgi:hypothetical protein